MGKDWKHANPIMAAALRALRRSNAAGTHDNRPNRQRTRGDSKRAAIKENQG